MTEIPEISRLVIKPGETLVLRAPFKLTPESREALTKYVREATGAVDLKILVIDCGMQISVLSDH